MASRIPIIESEIRLLISESYLQAQLGQSATWGRDETADVTGASRKDVVAWSVKMGLVEKIENLRPQLHVDVLGCLEVLVGRKIEVVKARPCHGVSSQVPIRPCCRSRERARVKPQVRSSQLLSRDVGKCRASGGDSLCGIVAEAG